MADGENIILSQIEQPLNKSDILSFEDKYISSEQMRILPAELDEDISSKIYDYSKKIYQHLDLNGVVRIDFLYDKKYGLIIPYFEDGLRNTIVKTLYKNNYIKEMISEKIRLFYVALTRAKEKMIFVTDLSKKEDVSNEIVPTIERLSFNSLIISFI